ncbi:MAG: 23S rRNA (adenine(2503)-C(2))-methyltransferase RlmN [Spirochaetales bacterium]|nr:23S rRNA (adenine(2503)-C(2))-methyltransferase RlmN [Spirochaetales bacterium]
MKQKIKFGAQPFGMSLSEWEHALSQKYGKGRYHAEALFRHLHQSFDTHASSIEEFQPALPLAEKIERDFPAQLPSLGRVVGEGGTRKFTLKLHDELLTESVLIPMSQWDTLCLSSQVGCQRSCAFCETARMGLVRNLDAGEIVAQWACAVRDFGVTPRNIVFMGMGEPFDNFEQVIRAVRVLSDPRGPGIPKRRICISTCGHVDGLQALGESEQQFPEEAFRTLHLAVSVNASNDVLRNKLMPINRQWSLSALKQALLALPQSKAKDALYFEYVVIPGVNSSVSDAEAFVEWLDGMGGKVNIIPYHPTGNTPWQAPDDETMDTFHSVIRASGRECRTRKSKGKGIEAACGMLGKEGKSQRHQS